MFFCSDFSSYAILTICGVSVARCQMLVIDANVILHILFLLGFCLC